MTVEVGGRPVGGPSRVGNTHVLAHALVKVDVLALLEDLLLEQLDLAGALHQDSGGIREGTVNPDTSRVIAAILQTFEARDQNVKNLFSTFRSQMIEIRKNSTHYKDKVSLNYKYKYIGSRLYSNFFIASTNPHSYH